MPKKKNTKIFTEDALAIHGDRYDYSKVDYKGNKIKVVIGCVEHGDFLLRPNNHTGRGLKNQGCPKCATHTPNSPEDFLRKANEIHEGFYDYSLFVFERLSDKVDIICPLHGVFTQSANSHVRGGGCKKCADLRSGKANTRDFKYFSREFEKAHGDKYRYLKETFVKGGDKMTIVCSEHGEFLQSPSVHRTGVGCPSCKESKGEKKISEFLEGCGVNYIRQKIFKGCSHENSLKFDFFVGDRFCIEYQGEQHYIPVKNWGGEEALETNKKRDQIKRDFCKENNIPLLEIKYNDKNWKRKLKNFIKI